MKVRKIPNKAVEFVKREEGCVLHVYKDTEGYDTIGVGHLIRKGETFPAGVTEDEAEDLLRKDLLSSAASIARLIHVPLTEGQYIALLSFTFNLGGGALQRSTLRSRLNRGEYASASEEFPKWCWAGGKKEKGLYYRRIREMNLFLQNGESETVDE